MAKQVTDKTIIEERREIETLDGFKRSRRKAYYSLKTLIEGFGYKVDPDLFEDSYQSALLHDLKYPDQGDNFCISHQLPYQAVLNSLTRQYYKTQIDWLQNNSIEVEIETMLENKQASDPYYRPFNSESKYTELAEVELKADLQRALTSKQYFVAIKLYHGYRQADIARVMKVTQPAIREHVSRIKLAFIAGAI